MDTVIFGLQQGFGFGFGLMLACFVTAIALFVVAGMVAGLKRLDV